MTDPGNANVLSSATRVLRALDVICESDAPTPLSALAQRLECSEVSAYRAVQTLIAAGFARAAEGGRAGYEPTWHVVELAAPMLTKNQLRLHAQPSLRVIAAQYDESITLAIPDGPSVLFVDRVSGPRTIEFFCDVGRRLPLHIGAASRVVLAHYPDDLFEEYLRGDLARMTEGTKTEPEDLRRDRELIRQRGYAVSREDVEVGITGVAAPVFNAQGQILGAAAIANISARWSDDDVAARGELMKTACAEISERSALLTHRATLEGR